MRTRLRVTTRQARWFVAVLVAACGLAWAPAGAVEKPKDPASTIPPDPVEEVAPEAAAADAGEAVEEAVHSRTIDLDGPVTIYRVTISGTIDLGLAPFVERVAAEAREADNGVLLLDIDTFGGRVDAAVLIRDALFEAGVPTIAFINPRAISAGALISLACNVIAITPGGTIGAATPITGGGGNEKPEAADEKFMSYMRTEMRATAERRGRRGDVAEAMVDPDVYVRGVIEKGKVLTLTTADAMRTGISDYQVDDLDALLAILEVEGAEMVDRELNWTEKIARAVSAPMVTSLLLSIGMLGLMLELYSPGWGIPGTLGVTCLTVFFFGHHVVNLAGNEEILLFVLGLVLLAIEMFVIPGFGIVGLAGGVCVLGSILMSLVGLDLRVSWDLGYLQDALTVLSMSMLMTASGIYLAVRFLPRTRASHRLVLGNELTVDEGYASHSEVPEDDGVFIGADAVALTDLRPSGKIQIEGRRREAVSEGGYVNAGATVEVVAWRSGAAVVRSRSAGAATTAAPEAESNGEEQAS